MDIAGLSFAVLDQLLKLLDYIGTKLEESKEFGKDAQKLRIRMDDEQNRLQSFQKLLFDKPFGPKNECIFNSFRDQIQHNILEMLRQLRQEIWQYIPIQIRYQIVGSLPMDLLHPSQTSNTILTREFTHTGIEEKAQNSIHILQKVSWVGWDKKRAEKILQEVVDWNNRIKANLELSLLELQIQLSTRQTLDTGNIFERLNADHDAWKLGLANSAQLRKLTFSENFAEQNAPLALDLKATPIRLLGIVGHLTTGLFFLPDGSKVPVLLEHKYYEKPETQTKRPPAVEQRIRQLAALLTLEKPDTFHILNCRGYYHEPDATPDPRYSFVFDLPPETPSDSRPISLMQSFHRRPIINLTEKYKVAHALSIALSQLHLVGWIHKSLRSELVLFFPRTVIDENGTYESLYDKPIITGFEYTRPSGSMTDAVSDDDINRNIYRHPDRQGTPRRTFSKYHDIYSLGVILLELGIGRSIIALEQDGANTFADWEPEQIKKRLLRYAEQRLAVEMGKTFHHIVKKCILGDFDTKYDDKDETILMRKFREEVVEPLEKIALII